MGIKKRQRTEEWVRRNSRAVIVANFKHRAKKREMVKEEMGIPILERKGKIDVRRDS